MSKYFRNMSLYFLLSFLLTSGLVKTMCVASQLKSFMENLNNITDNRDVVKATGLGFVILNYILLTSGVLFIVLGVWSVIEARGFILNSLYITANTIILVTGLVFIIMSLMALIGYQNNIRIFLQVYFLAICVLTVLMIIGLTCAMLFRESLSKSFRYFMIESTTKYFKSKMVQDSWDVIQSRFNCCGISTKDFDTSKPYLIWMRNSEFTKPGGPYLPESCCMPEKVIDYQSYFEFLIECQGKRKIIYTDDCMKKLNWYIKPRVEAMVYGTTAMTVFCLIVIACSWLLIRENNANIRKASLEQQTSSIFSNSVASTTGGTVNTRSNNRVAQNTRRVSFSTGNGQRTKIPVSENGGLTIVRHDRGQRADSRVPRQPNRLTTRPADVYK